MELVEDKHNSQFQIKNYRNESIVIGDQIFNYPIIFVNGSIEKFAVNKPGSINFNDIRKILCDVEILLIGTGKVNVILDENLINLVYQAQKGLEFMNTESACKTHNLLLSENRSFSSILYP
mgnify:FL=1